MSHLVRCRNFDEEGRPVGNGCPHGATCGFVHPENPAWSTSVKSNRGSRGRGRGLPGGPGRDIPGRSADTGWAARRRTSGDAFGGASPAGRGGGGGGWESPHPAASKPSETSEPSTSGWGASSQSGGVAASDPWGSAPATSAWGSSSGWGSSSTDKDKNTANDSGWGSSSGGWGDSGWGSTDTSNKNAASTKGKEKESSSAWSSGWGSTTTPSTGGAGSSWGAEPLSAASTWSSSASTMAPSASPASTVPPSSAPPVSGDWSTSNVPNAASTIADPRRRPSVQVNTDVADVTMSDVPPSTPLPPPEPTSAIPQSKRQVSSQKPKEADMEKWKDPVRLLCQAIDARHRYELAEKQKIRLKHSQHSGYYSRSSPAAQNMLDAERMSIEQTMQILSKKRHAAIEQLTFNTDLVDVRLQELAGFNIPADVDGYLNQLKRWMQLVDPQIKDITQPPEQPASSADADEDKPLPPLDLSQPPQLEDVTILSKRLKVLAESVEELKAELEYSSQKNVWEEIETKIKTYEAEKKQRRAESAEAPIVLPPVAQMTLAGVSTRLDEAHMQQAETRDTIAGLHTSVGKIEADQRVLETRSRAILKQCEDWRADSQRQQVKAKEQLEEINRKLDAAQTRASQRPEEMQRVPQVEQLHTELASGLKPLLEATVKDLVEKHVSAVLQEQLNWYHVDTRKKNELILAYVWDKLVRFSSYVPEAAAGTRQTA
ncbi:hypothetical protein CONPUDRAFT_162434 [Coniophora puteana RWD-64-598 SS2]|uniref:C3H1-type domain-containing protein n=1 Tax=Coniophora puteana (strain RWD-64-598) TaxID=741705 RepID=A0A5M3N1C4_CONPW|nr:uncharacterized protein CONPUDRAFT_162434 [Coniophora puteana RWD-64-598 SS2]EIW85178.1 hypothetical protein CONPUDRAFT_162434 [Coniophora puteana RWD-64-598 SS2]